MRTSSAAARKPKAPSKPFRRPVDRVQPNEPHSRAVTSPRAPEPAGPVIAAGKFKATCLQLLDRSAAGETITITKHGKVVGRLVPPEPAAEAPFVPLLGLMKGRIKILGDIVSPDFEAWGMEDPYKTKKKKK